MDRNTEIPLNKGYEFTIIVDTYMKGKVYLYHDLDNIFLYF